MLDASAVYDVKVDFRVSQSPPSDLASRVSDAEHPLECVLIAVCRKGISYKVRNEAKYVVPRSGNVCYSAKNLSMGVQSPICTNDSNDRADV